jgi:glutathione S-transferase
MRYLSVAEARALPGVRLVLTAGVPGPWSEAAKAVLRHHGVRFAAVAQEAMGANAELAAWTGCRNAPQLVVDDEPALTGWHDILAWAERHGGGAPLLPADPAARADALGLCALIAGPDGLGWTHRLAMLAGMGALNQGSPLGAAGRTYGCSPAAVQAGPGRVAAMLHDLDARLARGAWLCGDGLTAADLYWAVFSNMFRPLPADVNPMPEMLWRLYSPGSADVEAALTPALIAHRDRVWRDHIGLPLDYPAT